MPIGTYYSASDIKNALRDANKAYDAYEKYALQTIGYSDALQQETLKQDYSDAVSAAYTASQQSATDIMDTSLGQGYKNALMENNRKALSDAYEQYRTNYLTNLQKVQASTAESAENVITNVDNILTQEAKYGQQYLNDILQRDYINWLYENDDNTLFGKNGLLSEYVKDGDLLSWDELQTSFYDNEGNITDEGKLYYKRLLSNMDTKNSLTAFLQSNDDYSELADYLLSSNDAGERNIDVFNRELLGLTGTQNDYFNTKAYEDKQQLDEFNAKAEQEYDEWYKTSKFADNSETGWISMEYYTGTTTGKGGIGYIRVAREDGSYSPDQLKDNITNLTKGMSKKNSSKRIGEYVELAKNGKLPNGTLIDINAGPGKRFMIYVGGKFYYVDYKDNETSKMKVPDEYTHTTRNEYYGEAATK